MPSVMGVLRARFRALTKYRSLGPALCILALAGLVAAPAQASAAAVFAGEYPAGVIHSQPTIVGVDAFNTISFDSLSAKIAIDGVALRTYLSNIGTVSGSWVSTEVWDDARGVWVIKWTWVPSGSSNRATLTAYPILSYGDGLHSVVATITDLARVTSTDRWTFDVEIPPVVGTPVPAASSVVTTQTPAISVPVTDNGPGTMTATATVNGVPRSATVSAGVARVAPTTVPNDATTTVSVTVIDPAGNKTTKSWKFWVEVYSDMTASINSSCNTCHPTAANSPDMHPECAMCHTKMHLGTPITLHTRATLGSDCSPCHVSDITVEHNRHLSSGGTAMGCATCHTSTNPNVVSAIRTGNSSCVACHPTSSHEGVHTTTVPPACAGSGCHVGTSLTGLHITANSGLTCATCHSSQNVAVLAAIAGHVKDCSACHPAPHQDLPVKHTATLGTATITISGVDFPNQSCADCHVALITTEHAKASASSSGASCGACHPTPVSTLSPSWAKGCVQNGCHSGASTAPMHATIDGDHAIRSANSACLASGCHDATAQTPFVGKSLAEIHSAVTTTVAGVPRSSCALCHADGIPASGDCTSCHPERAVAHGYPPAKHQAAETCFLGCHQNGQELGPVHQAASPAVTCSGCHPVKVAAVTPWDKTCSACHPTLARDHAPASHVGTDTAYQDASMFGNGCSTVAGHTEMLFCHDISSLSELHSTIAGTKGCPICHGDGNTPKKECYDCHKPGYATSYTVPGAATADLYPPNAYPVANDSITPAWTYTTTPAAQPIWNVLNSVYPPVDTSRYITITSNLAGTVLVKNGPITGIPDGATIRDVRIYAKGKVATFSPARKMQGVFKIGGTTYLSAGTGTQLNTSWTSGAGTGFATNVARNDWIREPFYGETLWMNPKTGMDWTPAELNGTDPDSSLEAFGVNITSSATPNNVSLSQLYVKVTYYTVGPTVTNTTVGTHIYHGNNVKYLHDSADAPAGQRWMAFPPYYDEPGYGDPRWYDALYYQDCYDFCHRGNYGAPTFSAEQGKWMWYSVGGDPKDSIAATRTLTLKAITLPAGPSALTFRTNFRLGVGAAGYVEVSDDDGTSWTTLTGTVGGTNMSSLEGTTTVTSWTSASYDLSTYVGRTVTLRFRYVNGSSKDAGWAFDTLAVTSGTTTLFSDDAETLKPDWTNHYWTRSMGAFPK